MKKKILFCFAVITAAILIVGSFTLNASSGSKNCTGPKELVDGIPECQSKNTAPCSDMQGCKSKARQATIKIAQ